jgi:dolichol-phosphate mannosyltransferase
LQFNEERSIISNDKVTGVSIIIPTYNESQNILRLIEAIRDNLLHDIFTEVVVVDDNSPDGTGTIVEKYIHDMTRTDESNQRSKQFLVKAIHRYGKSGLISAILEGVASSSAEYILVMDADFSHSPQMIPIMVNELLHNPDHIVVASRYSKGGSVVGWPIKRKIISKGATMIARRILKLCNVSDPMSGFFACRRNMIESIKIDTIGYKLLLEVLVKTNNRMVKEIPYTFTDRKFGQSKMDFNIILDYIKAIWHLYRHGQKSKRQTLQTKEEKRKSVLFLYKAGRFFTVGGTGLLVNYLVSYLLSNGILARLWYIEATIIGIACSITSNFFLNKAWTFEDRNFSARHTLKQYGLFVAISSAGAALQLIILYLLVQSGEPYEISLILAVVIASMGNFLLNKKLTFREKLWG